MSASQDDVLQLRSNQAQKLKLNEKHFNNLIKLDADKEQDVYFAIQDNLPYQPYQIKNRMRPERIEMVEFDDDDDSIFLQQQPFETAMQIGYFSMYLNHLKTKSFLRRSDVIFSSTVNFSMTPVQHLSHVNFATMTA